MEHLPIEANKQNKQQVCVPQSNIFRS